MRRPIVIVTGNGRIVGAFTSMDVAAQALAETHKGTGNVHLVPAAKERAYLIYLYPMEGGNIPGLKHGERKLLGVVQEIDLHDKAHKLIED